MQEELEELRTEPKGSFQDFSKEARDTKNASPEAQLLQFHRGKLREPAIHTFIQLLTSTPHLLAQLQQRYEIREQFRSFALSPEEQDDLVGPSDEMERIERLVPLLSTIFTVPEARAYFQVALDQAAQAESQRIKDQLLKGDRYVPEIIVGAGPSAAIYNSELRFLAPNNSALTTESTSHLGGQFRSYDGAVINMNSPNASVNQDLPGQVDNLNQNPFGPHAGLQLAHVSGRLFAENSTVGLVAAWLQWFSGRTMLNCTLTNIELNPDRDSSRGRFRVHYRDTQSAQEFFLNTDNVSLAVGMERSDLGLPKPDQRTQAALQALHDRIYVYDGFLQTVGDRTEIDPLKNFHGKRVLIVGGGHGGLTVAESLLGLGPEYRGYVSALGGPASVTIIGSKYNSRESMLGTEYARYAQLATMLEPEQGPKNRRKTILEMIKSAKVFALESRNESDDGPVIAHYRVPDGQGSFKEQSIEADVIIFTTGNRSMLASLCKPLLHNECEFLIDRQEADKTLHECIKSNGTVLRFRAEGVYDQLEILAHFQDEEGEKLTCRLYKCDGSHAELEVPLKGPLAASLFCCDLIESFSVPGTDQQTRLIIPALECSMNKQILAQLLSIKGASLDCTLKGADKKLEVVDLKRDANGKTQLLVHCHTSDGSRKEIECGAEELFAKAEIDLSQINRLKRPSALRMPTDLPCLYDQSGKLQLGRYLAGFPSVRIIGAAAQLPLSQNEELAALTFRMPANSVALATNQEIVRCAIESASRHLKQSVPILFENHQKPEPYTDASGQGMAKAVSKFRFNLEPQIISAQFAAELDLSRLLNLLLRAHIQERGLTAIFKNNAMQVRYAESDTRRREIEVSFENEIPAELSPLVHCMLADATIQSILSKILKARNAIRINLDKPD